MQLFNCDFITTKLLLESRRFDYVKMNRYITKNLDNICIDIKEVDIYDGALNDVLTVQSIKTKSLIISYSEEYNIISLNEIIRFVFILNLFQLMLQS